MILCW